MKTVKATKELQEFANCIVKLEVTEFIGLCKLLCVHVFDNTTLDENGKPSPRKGEDIVVDCIDKFSQLNRAKRREIMSILRPIGKKR